MRCPPRLHKLGCKRIGENGFNLAGMGNIFHHRRSVHNENIKKVRFRFGRGSKDVRSRYFDGGKVPKGAE